MASLCSTKSIQPCAACVCGEQGCFELQASKVLCHSLQASGIDIHGDKFLYLGLQFKDMAGLAPRGCAGIEYTFTRLCIQQYGG